MELRERIRRAIQEPVARSEQLLDELEDANVETTLSILISGWGRGLAAALEELAIAIDQLRRQPTSVVDSTSPPPEPPPPEQAPRHHQDQDNEEARADLATAGEAQLLEKAKRSREQTTQLREESRSARS
jgi:hypothetical protein